jgi:hypothetical protein
MCHNYSRARAQPESPLVATAEIDGSLLSSRTRRHETTLVCGEARSLSGTRASRLLGACRANRKSVKQIGASADERKG